MRSLMLATAALVAISYGVALAAGTGSAGTGGASAGSGTGTGGSVGGGNGGMPANGLSTPNAQPPNYGVTANRTGSSMSNSGTVISKPTSNPQANAAAPGSQ